jgi:dTDP-3,4-didehydro-2,6-dideoxy-alpha-D-glucose 3-reductase
MLKFAVIGCGSIAQKSTIPALINSGVSEIAVCIDKDPNRENEIKAKFTLPFETSLNKALGKYTFEAVYISTPVATHRDLILIAAKHKKHILCEKSIVSNPDEAKEIVKFCHEEGVAVFEGFMYQFHTQHKLVKDLIASNEIGTPFHFQGWFGFPPLLPDDFRYNKSLGGGAILDAGSYTVHAARKLFNAEPLSVNSVIEYEDNEVEIRGSAMLNFGNSKTAHIVFGFNNMYQNKYWVWGTKGLISLERAFSVPPDYRSILKLKKQGFIKEFPMEPCNHFIEEIRFFSERCNNIKFRTIWGEEIINQSITLNKLRDRSIL